MERFQNKPLNKKDYKSIEVFATIARILLTPVFIWYRIYLWVWDGTMFRD